MCRLNFELTWGHFDPESWQQVVVYYSDSSVRQVSTNPDKVLRNQIRGL